MLPTVSNHSASISHDSTDGSFALNWDAERKCNYPIYFSTDLENWTHAGNLLSMDDTPNLETNITSIATAAASFYISSTIDYSTAPEAPQAMLASGGVLELKSNGGTLSLTFDADGGGTWRFIHTNGVTPTESGNITSSSQTDNSNYPLTPTTGTFISSDQTYVRSLSLRQITVYLDGSAGPDLLTAIQPALSFHSETAGWFDGAVNSDSLDSVIFRGEFTYTVPMLNTSAGMLSLRPAP